jgi:hypothetical protein
MHNQHAGLSQVLAEQHRTQRQAQDYQVRLARGAHPSRRRRRWTDRDWWQLALLPGAADQPVHRP